MTDFIDGAAVFEAREAAVRASTEANQPTPQPSALGWSPRVSVGPDTSAFAAPVDPGLAIDAYLNRDNPDVLATGRSQSGAPRHMSELKPTDLVTINGTPLEVRSALRLGYLDGAPGSYRDTGLAAKEAGQSGAQEVPKAEVKPDYTGNETAFDDHRTENLLANIAGATHAGAQIRAMVDVINVEGASAEISANTIRAMADATGVSPQQLQADLAQVQNAYAGQAAKFVMGSGVPDPEAFFEWAERNHRGQFKDAMSQHVTDRNPKAYAKLVSTYLASSENSIPADIMDAVCSDGVAVRKVDGQVVLDLRGHGTVSFKSAVRRGLIQLSRR